MKRYTLIENDTNNNTNTQPTEEEIQQLGRCVDGIHKGNQQAKQQFNTMVQQKYGIKSPKDLNTGMSKWAKASGIGFFGLAFINAVHGAIWMAYLFVKKKSYLDIASKGSLTYIAVSLGCVLLSFIFYRIVKYFMKQQTKKTESIDYMFNKNCYRIVNESIMFNEQLCNLLTESILYEAEEVSNEKMNTAVKQSQGICETMFNWVKSAYKWFSKHSFFILMVLIVIGFVFQCGGAMQDQVISRGIEQRSQQNAAKFANSFFNNYINGGS